MMSNEEFNFLCTQIEFLELPSFMPAVFKMFFNLKSILPQSDASKQVQIFVTN